MFEVLMQLPLFQGMSSAALSGLVEKYRFHFLKFADGQTIVEAGERCTHVRFVVSGSARLTTRCRHLDVAIEQTLAAPQALAPDALFGIDTGYRFTAVAQGTCGVLQIAKADYVTMLQNDKVMLFNLLNNLASGAQQRMTAALGARTGSVAERLATWIATLTTAASTDVAVVFAQRDLCLLLGAQRKSLVAAIDRLSRRGLLTADQHRLLIADRKALLRDASA